MDNLIGWTIIYSIAAIIFAVVNFGIFLISADMARVLNTEDDRAAARRAWNRMLRAPLWLPMLIGGIVSLRQSVGADDDE